MAENEKRGCVLVNGGSRGIGSEIVRAFRGAGYNVAFTYKSAKEAAALLSRETGALAICADSALKYEIEAAVREAEEAYGFVSVLVNNAALSLVKLFDEVSEEEWRRLCAVNLDGALFYASAVLRGMIRRKNGRIINITSMWGEVGASMEVHYSVTKAGLIGFTKALAKEVGPSGITVNAVSPGLIDTEMNAHLSMEDKEAMTSETPLGRMGSASDVAAAVLFLASEGASYVTGQVLGVNGGLVI